MPHLGGSLHQRRGAPVPWKGLRLSSAIPWQKRQVLAREELHTALLGAQVIEGLGKS